MCPVFIELAPNLRVIYDWVSMDKECIFLTVIIPAYNEQNRISATLTKIIHYLDKQNYKSEIIVVDDGSQDDTAAKVSGVMPKVQLIRLEKNKGKGFAIKTGVLSAQGSYLLFSDADLSTPIEEVEKFLDRLKKGADIVIGSRALKESQIIVRQPWYRETMGKIFNFFVRFLIMDDIKDTQCGFKAFKIPVAQRLFQQLKIQRFSFDVEILYIAKKTGYRVEQLPIVWANNLQTSVHSIKDSTRMLVDLLKIRFRGTVKRFRCLEKIFFILFFIFFISTKVFSQYQSTENFYKNEKEILLQFENFKNSLSKNWEYECSDDHPFKLRDPGLEMHIQKFSERVIYEGLKKIEELNPELAYFAVKNCVGRTLLVSCENSEIENAYTSFRERLILRDKMFLGESSWMIAVMSKFKRNGPFPIEKLREGFLKLPFPAFENLYQFYADVIFHEFLHFARIDNFSSKWHNRWDSVFSYRQDDLTYACSTQAYPFGRSIDMEATFLSVHYVDENTKRLYRNTNRACMSCASTLKGAEYLSPYDKYLHTKRAIEQCKSIRDEEYMFYLVKKSQSSETVIHSKW